MDHTVFVPVLNHENIRAYKDKKFYRKVMSYFLKWPFWTLVATGFTPIPFFPFKFLAFSVGYPMWKLRHGFAGRPFSTLLPLRPARRDDSDPQLGVDR